MRPITIIGAFILTLIALAGCGPTPTLEVHPEQGWCAAQNAYVDLVNLSPSAQRYNGWQLIDPAGTIDLPAFRLGPGESLRVWRGAGQGDDQNLYLAQPDAAWTRGELVSVQIKPWLFSAPKPVFTTLTCDLSL